jgi:hypothetical protein
MKYSSSALFILSLFLSLNVCAQQKDSLIVGKPASLELCSTYENHENWLPDAFINNAKCACLVIPNTESANIIRQVLIERLDSVPPSIKMRAIAQKTAYRNGTLSKRKYKKYIIREITPIIYNDHKIAYVSAGCKGDPAPLWGWKKITTRKVNSCKLVWFAIRYFGGSCTKRLGKF